MDKYLIHEDTRQLSELNWCPVPFQTIWSIQVLDAWLMAMTRAQLDARHCTRAWTPRLGLQAMLGRLAVGICNVSSVSTAEREKISLAAVCSGAWCTNMSQWNKGQIAVIAKPTPDFPFCPFLVLDTSFVQFWDAQKCIPLLFPRLLPDCGTDWICSACLAS